MPGQHVIFFDLSQKNFIFELQNFIFEGRLAEKFRVEFQSFNL